MAAERATIAAVATAGEAAMVELHGSRKSYYSSCGYSRWSCRGSTIAAIATAGGTTIIIVTTIERATIVTIATAGGAAVAAKKATIITITIAGEAAMVKLYSSRKSYHNSCSYSRWNYYNSLRYNNYYKIIINI